MIKHAYINILMLVFFLTLLAIIHMETNGLVNKAYYDGCIDSASHNMTRTEALSLYSEYCNDLNRERRES